MERKQYSIEIAAEREKVWRVLWEDESYRKWTAAFTEGSHVKTDGWEEGSKVQFLDPKGSGMYSRIAKHVPNRLMAFEHIGEIHEGKEQPIDEKSRKWSGAQEIYQLEEDHGKVRLEVELDMEADHADMFDRTFPEALKKVKELAEN